MKTELAGRAEEQVSRAERMSGVMPTGTGGELSSIRERIVSGIQVPWRAASVRGVE